MRLIFMETVELTPLSMDDFPSYEELALDWTLSLDDTQFILHTVKGTQQTLYFTAALKSLRNIGVICNVEELSKKTVDYLAKQLSIPPTMTIKISDKSKLLYQQKIKSYLGYCDFDIKAEKALEAYVQSELRKELFSVDLLKEKSLDFLKKEKIIRPAPTVLERLLASYKKETLDYLYEKLANKLTAEQKTKILALLKCEPNLLSQINYLKKFPPEPTAAKINTFIHRFNTLADLGLIQINFSDISEVVFNQLELLGKTYDANAINKLRSENKKIALLLCTLTSISRTLLDHVLDMNDKLLAKKERIAKNAYYKKLKIINKQAKKGLTFLINTTNQWWKHRDPNHTTLSAFKETIDQHNMIEALTACEQLINCQEKGFYEILENKYTDLRKYTINLIELDFKGAKGTEDVLTSINILRELNSKKSNELPDNVPTSFVPKTWKKAMSQNNKLSRRTWEMALYYELNSHFIII